jgi:hypothetical protein
MASDDFPAADRPVSQSTAEHVDNAWSDHAGNVMRLVVQKTILIHI